MFKRLRQKIEKYGGTEFVYLSGISIASYAAADILFLGYSVYTASGVIGSVIVFAICCSALYAALISLIRTSLSANLSSLDMVNHYFGKQGARFCAAALALTFLGWFLWQLNFCVMFIKHHAALRIAFFKTLSDEKIGVFLGLLCCAIACTEKTGLRLVAFCFVPVLLILLVSLFCFLSPVFPEHAHPLSTIDFSTLSILFGGFAALVMYSPTFFKSAGSVDIARRSLKLTYLVILPFFYVSGVLFGVLSPSNNVLSIARMPSGVGPFVLLAFVIVCGLNICSTNLFYGADVVAQVTSPKSRMPMVFLLSSVGILFYSLMNSKLKTGSAGIEFLGSLVVGMLSIILTKTVANNFRMKDESLEQQRGNYLALLISYAVGLFVWTGVFKITGVQFFDIALTSFIMCLYFMGFPPKLKILNRIR
ncbi:MAG: hypothetical protein LBQ43_01575 [Holosporales bacterium]|nr:hypothetical protein [Holosporales bacterium]